MVDDGWIWLSQPWLILASFFIFLVLFVIGLVYNMVAGKRLIGS